MQQKQTSSSTASNHGITRRRAVQIIAGASAAFALSPTMAFAEETASTPGAAQDRELLMNSWRFQNGEPVVEVAPYSAAPLGSGAPYGRDPEGNWCNSQGNPIPGALLRGIDVSEHQGWIDWATVGSRGDVDYAIVRCGYGSDYSSQDDKQFLNNIQGCLSNGIPFGLYLYSYACNTSMARSEAEHVLRTMRKAGISASDLTYPVYLDLEQESGGRPSGVTDSNGVVNLSNAELLAIAETFCSILQANGITTGIYANLNWWNNFLTGSAYNKWSRWVAQYNVQCDYTGSYDMWQAGSDASIAGISGNVDVNFDFVGYWDSEIWSRVYGQHHLDTMALISQKGWTTSEAVVVATEATYWDALTSSALAGIHNCPIILTYTDELASQAAKEISRLGAKTAYVVGGPIAIASSVDAQIKAAGCTTVERVYGNDQQGTARAIAARVSKANGRSDTCIIATSYKFQDALSVSPYAFWAKAPIYLCEDGSNILSADTLEDIRSAGYKKAVIVGGPIAVDAKVESQLAQYGVSSVKRVYGETEYETSQEIANWEISQGMTANKAALATGVTYYDALAGGALCGKNGSTLVIASDANRSCIDGFIRENRTAISTGYVLGGPIAVSNATWRELLRAQAGR